MNSKMDVALLRAAALENDDWAPVRLEKQAAKGESIATVSNAGFDIGGLNADGLTIGVVSNPALDRQGRTFLSADITIAQGSSGGALVSLATGEVIGVVQMVATSPGIPGAEAGGVASTGYLCLAAPSDQLTEWLGLELRAYSIPGLDR